MYVLPGVLVGGIMVDFDTCELTDESEFMVHMYLHLLEILVKCNRREVV